MSFDTAFARTVDLEGGYTNNPSDRGGPTKFGITEKVARAHGYTGDMRDLPRDTAKAIYRTDYWDALYLTLIDARAPHVAEALFDTAVNAGIATAAEELQVALNAFNRQQKDYPDVLPVDGAIGRSTLQAYQAFLNKRGPDGIIVLARALNALRGARYLRLTQSRPADEDFVFGWFLNRIT